jgi:hypothetical protein
MKLKAKSSLIFEAKKYEAGSVFEASTEHGLTLISLGWAEAVVEKKTPKKPARKK